MDACASKTGDYKVVGDLFEGFEEILTSDAMNFVASIQKEFGKRRLELLENRLINQKNINYSELDSYQTKVGPIIFEFFEPSASNLIYQKALVERGEGIADLIFLVDDLNAEIKKLLSKGVSLLDSNNNFAIFDTRKEGNTIIRLVNNSSQ